MNIAQRIVDKFGGLPKMAAVTGIPRTTIQHWLKTGIVSAKSAPVILAAAKKANIRLGPADLIAA